MSFLIYAVGLLIVLAGLVYGATLLGIGHSWIIACALVVNLTSALLRKRAGVNDPTVWQRLARKRRR